MTKLNRKIIVNVVKNMNLEKEFKLKLFYYF
jgi:hypothetical protein